MHGENLKLALYMFRAAFPPIIRSL